MLTHNSVLDSLRGKQGVRKPTRAFWVLYDAWKRTLKLARVFVFKTEAGWRVDVSDFTPESLIWAEAQVQYEDRLQSGEDPGPAPVPPLPKPGLRQWPLPLLPLGYRWVHVPRDYSLAPDFYVWAADADTSLEMGARHGLNSSLFKHLDPKESKWATEKQRRLPPK